MLKIKTVPVLSRIIAKIDLKPIIQAIKNADIFDNSKNKKDAMKQLTKEKVAELAFEIVSEITPQLGKIGEDIPEFVSMYYGISLEEAAEMDFCQVINDIINDDGIRSFFATALQKKVEREH